MKILSGLRCNMKKTGVRCQGSGIRQTASIFRNGIYLLFAMICVLSFIGCASPSSKLPPPPPKYVDDGQDEVRALSQNSLWLDRANLFEDRKAMRVNDLVTINIVESLSGSGAADTTTKRDSTAKYNLDNFFGMNNDFNLQNAFLLKDMYKGANIFEPEVVGSAKSEFKGEGDTNREGELSATITAKVVELLPNGNMILEARKDLTINEETQILVLRGVVRPDDISSENVVLSTYIADAEIFYVGDGVIHDKQKPGWLVRVMDNVWPF